MCYDTLIMEILDKNYKNKFVLFQKNLVCQ